MKYKSRKFIVTMSCVAVTVVLAINNLMTGDVGLVFAAAIGSYNIGNAMAKGYE